MPRQQNSLSQSGHSLIYLATAHNFLASQEQARTIFDNLITAIEQYWKAVYDEAKLSEVDKKLLWRRQFLNLFSTEQ